jgi:glycosyltransferase involved in cell wall biosynthesis
MLPLVSILLPVFNGEPFLAAALASLLGQTHPDFEIIAIDDGSTDASLETLRAAQQHDHRIRIVTRENRGLVATLNEGLQLARGRFVARMDADDIAYPERLAAQLAAFAANPGAAMCGTGFDTLFGGRMNPGGLDAIYQEGDIAVLARFYTIFIHSTVMYDRAVLTPEELRYDPRYPHAEDFDLFRRIAFAHPVIAEPRSLVGYRLHEGSVTARRKQEMRQTHVRIVAENLADCGVQDLDAMEAVVTRPAPDSIDRLTRLLRAIDAGIDQRPAAEQESWREGSVHLFYFFYTLVRDEGDARLVRQLLEGTGRGDLVRRRERIIAASGAWIGKARMLWRGLELVDAAQRRVTSRRFRPEGRLIR